MKLVIGLVIAVAACGGPSKQVAKPVGPPPTDAVKQWVQDVMTAYEHADAAAFEQRIATGGLFIGTGPEEVWDSTKFLDAHHKMLSQVKPGSWHLKSNDLRVFATPDGNSAWMSNLFDWDFGGGNVMHNVRWTAVFVSHDGKWQMSASHVSLGVPNDMMMKLATDGKLAVPGVIDDQVDGDAKPLAALFDAELATPAQWAKDIADDAYGLGSDPGEVWATGAELRKTLTDQVTQFHMTMTRHGGVRAHVTPGGQLGWVIANVDLALEAEPGKKLVIPFRTLCVYEHVADTWKLVQMHVSNAIPNS
jgi:ketosteroid isomerase-like protein